MTIPGKRGRAASEGRNDDQDRNFPKSHDVALFANAPSY
jgi:hypothetical protein